MAPGGLPDGLGGAQAGRRHCHPPPSVLQTERGRKTSTAAEDNLALSSGATFSAGWRERPQNDPGPHPVAAATTPSAWFFHTTQAFSPQEETLGVLGWPQSPLKWGRE